MSTAQAKPTKPKAKAAAPLHPPYLQMITEAISSLKERGGSSSLAIGKYLEGKYKTQLPPNFRKLLTMQLRRFAKSAKLTKVKNSFKVGAAPATTGEKKPVGRPAKAGAAAKKPKSAGVKKVAGRPAKVAGEKKAVGKPAKSATGEKKAVKKPAPPKAAKPAVAAKPVKAKTVKAAKPAAAKAPKKVKTLKTVKSPAKKRAAPKAGRPAAAKKART